MSAQKNLEVARRLYDAANRHEADKALELLSPDVVTEMVPTGEKVRGRDGFREKWREGEAAFPDMRYEVDNLIASDDAVACEIRCIGTQTGPLKTPQGVIPPTNKKSEMRLLDIWELRDGIVIRGRTYLDAATMAEQMQKAA
jgi:steroid delta-isomerase-like uncharacterized protein